MANNRRLLNGLQWREHAQRVLTHEIWACTRSHICIHLGNNFVIFELLRRSKLPTESQYDFVMRTHETHFRRQRRKLSELSGVSLDTLNKIFQRQTKNPKARTVQQIYDVLIVCEQKAEPARVAEVAPMEPVSV